MIDPVTLVIFPIGASAVNRDRSIPLIVPSPFTVDSIIGLLVFPIMKLVTREMNVYPGPGFSTQLTVILSPIQAADGDCVTVPK